MLRSFCGPFLLPLRSVCGLQTHEQPRTRANTAPRGPAVRRPSRFSNQSGRTVQIGLVMRFRGSCGPCAVPNQGSSRHRAPASLAVLGLGTADGPSGHHALRCWWACISATSCCSARALAARQSSSAHPMRTNRASQPCEARGARTWAAFVRTTRLSHKRRGQGSELATGGTRDGFADAVPNAISRGALPGCRGQVPSRPTKVVSGAAAVRLRSASPGLKALLESLTVGRHLFLRLAAHDERHEQLADAVALEVERDRDA
jgi:hypothetical protein